LAFLLKTKAVSGLYSPIKTGTPFFIIPAFSLAIFEKLFPKN
jgi:hypothetical protein